MYSLPGSWWTIFAADEFETDPGENLRPRYNVSWGILSVRWQYQLTFHFIRTSQVGSSTPYNDCTTTTPRKCVTDFSSSFYPLFFCVSCEVFPLQHHAMFAFTSYIPSESTGAAPTYSERYLPGINAMQTSAVTFVFCCMFRKILFY